MTSGFLDVFSATSASRAAVMNECLRLCGLIRLAIPVRRAVA